MTSHNMHHLVRRDLREREWLGIRRYGTPLLPFNGRNALVDAYQEVLDLAVYLRQALVELGIDEITDQPPPLQPHHAACRNRADDEVTP